MSSEKRFFLKNKRIKKTSKGQKITQEEHIQSIVKKLISGTAYFPGRNALGLPLNRIISYEKDHSIYCSRYAPFAVELLFVFNHSKTSGKRIAPIVILKIDKGKY